MREFRIFIPRWRPALLNQLMCHSVRQKIRLRKQDDQFVKLYGMQYHVTPAVGKRLVSLDVILGPRMRVADEDAFWKSLQDALVRAGFLVDDSPKWLERGHVIQRRAIPGQVWGTTIIIAEVEEK